MRAEKNEPVLEPESKNKIFQSIGIIVSVSPVILLVIFFYLLANKFEDITMSEGNQQEFITMMNQALMVIQDYGDKFLLLASNVLTAYGTQRAMQNKNQQ